MRMINVGGKERQIEATPYSIILHEREFGTDLISDAATLVTQAVGDKGMINGKLFLSIVHTLEKTAKMKYSSNKMFPNFDAYMMEMESLSLQNQDAYTEVVTEIEDKFFREEKEEQETDQQDE